MDGAPSLQVGSQLAFMALGQRVRIDCASAPLLGILRRNFAAMADSRPDCASDIHYRIESLEAPPAFELSREGDVPQRCADAGDLIYRLEGDLVVELQRRRHDLLFLHSAAVHWRGQACLLAAESGSGKSTTAWGLLHHGFGYLSDELSPIDPVSLAVWPYPHALNVKRRPPGPYPLPERAMDLGRTIHVPVEELPESAVDRPVPLAVVFVLEGPPTGSVPALRALRPGEAGARMYANALNALAHPGHGLDAVVGIAERVPCVALRPGELGATCALLAATIRETVGPLAPAP